VIQRETVQPTVLHQTIGVHEKIHDAPIVHEATTLPTIGMSDFLKQKQAGGPQAHQDKFVISILSLSPSWWPAGDTPISSTKVLLVSVVVVRVLRSELCR